MHSTDNQQVKQVVSLEKVSSTPEHQSYKKQDDADQSDQKLLRYFIEYVKRTGDFNPEIPVIKEDLSLTPLQEQTLLRYFIEYVKRTGEFDYPMLLNRIEESENPPPETNNTSTGENTIEVTPEPEVNPPVLNDTTEEQKNLLTELIIKVENLTNAIQEVNHPQQSNTTEEPHTPPATLNATSSTVEDTENSPYSEPPTSLDPLYQLEEIQIGIINSTLVFKSLINEFADLLRSTNYKAALRNLIEQIPPSMSKEELFRELKFEHQKLTRYLDYLVRLAYNNKEKLQTVPLEIYRRSPQKIVRDLAYIRLYLEQHAQPTLIQQEIFLVNDPSVYLRRLNQYLDILPEMTAQLVNAWDKPADLPLTLSLLTVD